MAIKKTAAKKTVQKATSKVSRKKASDAPRSMPTEGRDPQGGLTAKGREFFNKKQGSHLRPGVQGPADTPEKMVRKGSFLRRHFAHPRGPMKDAKGEPSRLALSAHAWGEPVPDTLADAKRLADKGHLLLEQYHQIKDGTADNPRRPPSIRKSAKSAPKTTTKKAAVKLAAKVVARKSTAKRTSANKATAKTNRGPGGRSPHAQ